MGNKNACRVSMNRALHIFIAVYGEDSNEVLLHRAKMLTFQVSSILLFWTEKNLVIHVHFTVVLFFPSIASTYASD